MKPTTRLLAPGFLKRSLEELKRYTNIVIKQETIYGPSGPYELVNFADPSSITACKTMSDVDIGGFSEVALDHVPGSNDEPAHARFHGSISVELPPDRPEVHRTGYAAWRTKDRPPSIFGKSLWDIDPYTYVALRVKSDGRKYFVNVQTESIVPTDIHQHRLYTRKPGQWETVLIKWNDFVRTNHGVVVEPQSEMLRQRVRTIGIGSIDRLPGPFDLCIGRIWATNKLTEEELREDDRLDQNIPWKGDTAEGTQRLRRTNH
ncbi:putative complex I protein [Xylona heveae TC161]|uniref:Putative complex I protein n=1 Tax=Xylona heveae (strain CBS 132557 / TC161) TaxID=1328760 RepID=A0A165HY31_XYLHT|nr:putative complex I protein [Xylona heveae TC161]KZF24085.1 putative complex I protein [Xylona heveae TC161]